MKEILVTGGAGFLGSHLVERLLNEGKEVTIIDNLQKKGGLAYINPKARFIKGDIRDSQLYKELNNSLFEGIYHLAAQTSGEDSYRNPKEDILTNSYGTWMIANYCKEKKVPRFIYTSTSAVYGAACKDKPVNEETPIQPESIYGVSKYSGELFIKQLLKNTDTKYSIFRLTNNYGPGENLNFTKKGMVSIFCSQIWRNEPIEVRGNLDRFRDFLFVEDTIDALEKSYNNEKTFNQLYILSSGEKIFVKDLVNKIIKISGKTFSYPIKISGGTPGDTKGFHADISKIKKDLDWHPKHNLDEGLKKYFDWINKVPLTNDISNYHPLLIKR